MSRFGAGTRRKFACSTNMRLPAVPNNPKSRPTLVYKTPNALRHGVYSATAVLPGEDHAAFEKLHRDLVAEYSPDGPSECDIIRTIAVLIWRKKNLETLRMAALARGRLLNVVDEMVAAKFPDQPNTTTHLEFEKIVAAAKEQVCEELGDVRALLELGEAASFDSLSKVLDLEERLGGMIDKCFRRLLYARGLKSMPGAALSGRMHRIAGPSTEA